MENPEIKAMRKLISDNKSQQKIYHPMIGLRIRRDAGIYDALQRAADENGITLQAWILWAIQEKLELDGYMDLY